MSSLNIIIGLVGISTGSSGLVLGILNYFRDRPNVQVQLAWDMEPYGDSAIIYDENKSWCMISIANIGRRPIFVSHAYLKIPKVSEFLLVSDTISGSKLLEGDPPKNYPVAQEGLEKYADRWNKIKVIIQDSTGKKYYSKSPKECPSWAATQSSKSPVS